MKLGTPYCGKVNQTIILRSILHRAPAAVQDFIRVEILPLNSPIFVRKQSFEHLVDPLRIAMER